MLLDGLKYASLHLLYYSKMIEHLILWWANKFKKKCKRMSSRVMMIKWKWNGNWKRYLLIVFILKVCVHWPAGWYWAWSLDADADGASNGSSGRRPFRIRKRVFSAYNFHWYVVYCAAGGHVWQQIPYRNYCRSASWASAEVLPSAPPFVVVGVHSVPPWLDSPLDPTMLLFARVRV